MWLGPTEQDRSVSNPGTAYPTATGSSSEKDTQDTDSNMTYGVQLLALSVTFLALFAIFLTIHWYNSKSTAQENQTSLANDETQHPRQRSKSAILMALTVETWSSGKGSNCSSASHRSTSPPVSDETVLAEMLEEGTLDSESGPSGLEDSESETDEYHGSICAICLSAFADGQEVCSSKHKVCNHEFHLDCMVQWLQTRRSELACPLCRAPYTTNDTLDGAKI